MNVYRMIVFSCIMMAATASGQTVSREYVRLNGTVVAIESPDPVPGLLSLSPINGSGPSAVFTGSFSDLAGASHIQFVQFWFTSSSANCHLAYFPSVNEIYLDSSADNDSWVGNGTPGSGGVLSNGVCSVALATSSVASSGNNLSLSVNISFAVYAVYTANLAATNATGTNGWTSFGTWTAQANYQGAGVYDDRDSRLSYTGSWQQAGASGLYASTESYAQNSGSSVTFQFYGTTISYVYTMAQNIGYANIYIDGSLAQSNLDGYLAPTGGTANFLWQKLWTYTGLTAGNHTIQVVADGTKDSSSTGTFVTVDAFIVSTSYNDNSSSVSYSGSWAAGSATGLWNGDEHFSNNSGDSATFSFTGPFVTYVYAPYPNMGIANISIDGVSYGSIDEYCPSAIFQGSRTFAGLSSGSHTFKVTVSGTSNSSSSGTYLTADQFLAAQ